MSAILFAFQLALLAAVAFGVGDFFGGLATKRSRVVPVVVLTRLIGVIVVLLALTVHRTPLEWLSLFWGALAGLAGGTGIALLYRGLAVGAMSMVAPVTAAGGAAVPVIVGLLLGEVPSARALIGVGLALVAILLMTHDAQKGIGSRRGLPYALAAGAAFGGFFVFLSRADLAAGVWPLVASQSTALGLFVVVGAAARQLEWPPREALPAALAAGVLDALGTILLLSALYLGPLGLVAVLTSLYPAATVALAIIVLRERASAYRIAGFVCAGVSILLITAP